MVTIEDIEQRGYGVARHDGRVIFVEESLPGEVVEVQSTKRKRTYSFAKPLRFVKSSPDRIEPFCRHFASCGGCKWQFLPYEQQLEYKHYFVKTAFERIGKIPSPPLRPIIGAPADRLYRNKLEFSFSPTRWLEESEILSGVDVEDRRALGFHVRGRFDRVLNIDECWLQEEPSNTIRNRVRELALKQNMSFHDPRSHQGLLRGLVIRNSRLGHLMVTLVVAEFTDEAKRLLEAMYREFPEITSLNYIINERQNDSLGGLEAHLVAGEPYIIERCGHLTLRIDAASFYQTNSLQAERLYAVVEELAELTGKEELLDLYSGTGSIGLYLARRAAEVRGIESVPSAVLRARENARENNIPNARFDMGEVEKLLPNLPATDLPTVVVVDPPRSGLHPSVVKLLIENRPGPIVYVSCNPATQARDIDLLRQRYEVEAIQPVDMFPQTHHIESVARLVPRHG